MSLVSIGLPVWNGERYLADALDAILAQDFDDFEVLVSDNASTDRTQEIAQDYAARDTRITYHRQRRNLGAAANFNYTFHHTSAPLFRWASYDDAMAPEYLSTCVSALQQDSSGAVLAYPGTMRIDENGHSIGPYSAEVRKGGATASERLAQMIGPGDPLQSMIHMCFPVFGLIRRDVLEGTSLIANMPRSDKLLLVELALAGPFVDVEPLLFLRREHESGSVISAEQAATGADRERLLAAWFDPSRGNFFPATLSRLGLGYLRATLRAPQPLGERLRSLKVVAGWAARHARALGGEAKIVIRERLQARIYKLTGRRANGRTR